jgi:hypothetical protein
MNKIITTDIADPLIQQPFTADSLDFLQDANKEMVKAHGLSAIGKIYDPTKYYILSGLYPYGTNQYSEGYVFFAGELYYCAGKTTTTAFSNIAVLTLVESNASFDPVTFSDGTTHSVHKIRRFNLIDTVSGGGTVDLEDCIFIDRPISINPVFKAYNNSSVEVVGGFTAANYDYCDYTISGNRLNVRVKGQAFVIAAGVRYLTIKLTLPFSSIPVYGNSIVVFQQGGTTTGFAGVAEIDSTGLITIKNLAYNTDIPAIAATGYIFIGLTALIG